MDYERVFAVLGVLTALFFVVAFVRVVVELLCNCDFATALIPKLPKHAFDGRVVWVTGASSGVGKQVALHLARQRNVKITISSRSRDKLEQVKEECLKLNADASVFVLPLDLEKIDTMEEKACEVLKKFGRVDVLINNAGCSTRVFAHRCHYALDQYVTNVDYVGHVALVKALLPHFRSTGCATIMNTGSMASKIGAPARTGYSGAKHALSGYMNALRTECIITGVDLYIGNVCLGSTKTNLSFHAAVNKVPKSSSSTSGIASSEHGGSMHSTIETFGQSDPNTANGMSPKFVAERILAAAHHRKLPEIWLGKPREILILLLNQYLPNTSVHILSSRVLKHYAVIKDE